MGTRHLGVTGLVLTAAISLNSGCSSCTDDTGTVVVPPPTPAPQLAPAPAGQALPGLLMVQAQFKKEGARTVPGPAKLTLLRTDGATWFADIVEDPESNVFHKAMPWRDGILTISGEKARVQLWKPDESGVWKPNLIWEREWGGQFNRFRDVEIADVNGDGKEDLVLATHDQGVVAVGVENDQGSWAFHELDQKPDTFVHEVEVGDVDGDGITEFFATPSDRNKASGESQKGGVAQYEWLAAATPECPACGSFVRTQIADWTESHAKEILVTDADKDGKLELYAVREAEVVTGADGKPEIKVPVQIERLTPGVDGAAWTETVVATLDDRQCRFLVAGDVDGDGQIELVASGYKSGLWLFEPKGDGTFSASSIDADSTGFENATVLGDLDGNGSLEIYAAADDQHGVRRYVWNPATKGFDRTVIAPIGDNHLTWNLMPAKL